MAHWLNTLIHAVDREYDRRIRRASVITAYGASPDHAEALSAASLHDDTGIVIANLPRGAVVPSPAVDPDDAVVNLTGGMSVEAKDEAMAALVLPALSVRPTDIPALFPANEPALSDAQPLGDVLPTHDAAGAATQSDDEAAEIVNTPPGTPAKW